jgi:hypothetical protein
MIEATCDCGVVRMEIAEAPVEVNDCQCDWCQRLGALWAYYPRDRVRIISGLEATSIYERGACRLEFHRCSVCGLTAYWLPKDPMRRRIGVNARLMPREVRAGARMVQGH